MVAAGTAHPGPELPELQRAAGRSGSQHTRRGLTSALAQHAVRPECAAWLQGWEACGGVQLSQAQKQWGVQCRLWDGLLSHEISHSVVLACLLMSSWTSALLRAFPVPS